MKAVVAIMQPYFFPYIGYFQLISASDVFVLHDDVQYIKGGWVNRNRILLHGQDRMITLPVQKAPHDNPIKSRTYVPGKQASTGILNLIKEAYAKAPQYDQVRPMVDELLAFEDTNVARFNENAIRQICEFVGIRTRIVVSSSLVKDDSLTGQDRVVDICRRLGATDYINPIGGTALYRDEVFRACGVALHFLMTNGDRYQQYGDVWVPSLSILDMLMFNSVEQARNLLTAYQLLEPSGIVKSSPKIL